MRCRTEIDEESKGYQGGRQVRLNMRIRAYTTMGDRARSASIGPGEGAPAKRLIEQSQLPIVLASLEGPRRPSSSWVRSLLLRTSFESPTPLN
jgi:hypothetical protein